MLINVRVGLGWAQQSTVASVNSANSGSQNVIVGGRDRTPFKTNNYPLRPLAINIEHAVSNDHDYDSSSKSSKQIV